MMEDGITPSSMSIRNEVKIWSKIRHPNVLQFLGANILDEKPFIVMPYLKNGNARHYLQEHPDSDRLQILYDISLGLVHLHSHQIVHGDLKGLNVLVDDSFRAVLCDFGLSRVKVDATSRTAKIDGGSIMGSRNWMAPERLLGGSLKKPCDIYAFGMTLLEIYTNETPMGELSHSDFLEIVVRQDIRPERPDNEDAPWLSDAVWELTEKCWVKDPKHRPTAGAVCHTLSHLLAAPAIAQPVLVTSPSHPSSLPYAPVKASPPPRTLNPPSNLTMRGHTNRVYCATISPDGKYIVSGSWDRSIMVWDAQRGHLVLGPLKIHTSGVGCVAFSPNSRQIASGSFDATLVVWNATTGKIVAGPFIGHTGAVWTVSFSPDGKKVVSGSRDKTIWVWDAQNGDLLVGPLTGHTDSVTSVAFSGDSTRLCSWSADNTFRVWDVQSGGLVLGPLRGLKYWFLSIVFSLNGKRIISGSMGGDVCIWDTETGALVSGPSKRHKEGALTAAFSPNSTYYCAISPDGRWIAGVTDSSRTIVHVWDSKTGLLAATFSEHTGNICSVTFSPDSKRVVSSSEDKTVRIHTLDL